MHGSLMYGFAQFVKGRFGAPVWRAIADEIRATDEGWYVARNVYKDEELAALVQSTSARTGLPVAALLEDFGAALVPVLMSLYGALIDPRWRTLDLLANTEGVIHRAVRLRDPTASPPRLSVRRISEREVEVHYASQRRLCAVAVGICRGIAAHHGEAITIAQPRCMERGDASCLILVGNARQDPV